jgi:hypothetical protein
METHTNAMQVAKAQQIWSHVVIQMILILAAKPLLPIFVRHLIYKLDINSLLTVLKLMPKLVEFLSLRQQHLP